jgi:Ala-tRNA(Pro) deacylase
MIVVEENKRVDLKKIKENLDLNKLSFCKEDELRNILKIEPGSVTPLAAINDDENEVTIILDEDMVDKNILVHPLVNTATIKINYNDMIKLFNNLKTNYIVTNIPEKQELA